MIVAAIVAYLVAAGAMGVLAWVATRQGGAPVAVAVFWAVWLGVWWPYTLVFLVWRTRRRLRQLKGGLR